MVRFEVQLQNQQLLSPRIVPENAIMATETAHFEVPLNNVVTETAHYEIPLRNVRPRIEARPQTSESEVSEYERTVQSHVEAADATQPEPQPEAQEDSQQPEAEAECQAIWPEGWQGWGF